MSLRPLLLALALAGATFQAHAADLTIGYITGIDPHQTGSGRRPL